MKKFVVFFTLICMLSLLAVSAFAYDKTESDWAITADMQEDGTVKFTYNVGKTGFVELAIYDAMPDFSGKDMADSGAPYNVKIKRGNNDGDSCIAERIIAKGTLGNENEYPFEEGKKYYATICYNDGSKWLWAPDQIVEFTYSTKKPMMTPFDNDTLKVNVLEAFDDTKAIKNAYLGTPDGPIAITEKGFSDYYSFAGGKFTVKEGAAATSWVGVVDDNLKAMFGAAEGFGFYIKNTGKEDIKLAFYLVDSKDGDGNENKGSVNNAYSIGSEMEYALYSLADKTQKVLTTEKRTHPYNNQIVVHSSFVIPAGFEGYVMTAKSSVVKTWSSNVINDDAQIIGFGCDAAAGLEFDNIFVYGKEIEAKNAQLVLEDKPRDTADFSVIAYALAAITGCGALVIAKKR